ncbi:hypothetical protein HDA36_005846 [Nocardiopsis composta]|uniref:Uncharacterized protein n=1 Tax=Nocardiopsis composta TaxID=157465 RepID=A0A7W8VH04_9ACTN|nr:hypothetical protein [Nocardiopsis composta]
MAGRAPPPCRPGRGDGAGCGGRVQGGLRTDTPGDRGPPPPPARAHPCRAQDRCSSRPERTSRTGPQDRWAGQEHRPGARTPPSPHRPGCGGGGLRRTVRRLRRRRAPARRLRPAHRRQAPLPGRKGAGTETAPEPDAGGHGAGARRGAASPPVSGEARPRRPRRPPRRPQRATTRMPGSPSDAPAPGIRPPGRGLHRIAPGRTPAPVPVRPQAGPARSPPGRRASTGSRAGRSARPAGVLREDAAHRPVAAPPRSTARNGGARPRSGFRPGPGGRTGPVSGARRRGPGGAGR